MPQEPYRDVNQKELRTYRSIIGKILYIGRLCVPVIVYNASHMSKKTNTLQTDHPNQLRSIVKLEKNLSRASDSSLLKPDNCSPRRKSQTHPGRPHLRAAAEVLSSSPEDEETLHTRFTGAPANSAELPEAAAQQNYLQLQMRRARSCTYKA